MLITVRRQYKSKKMLFFIVLAEETNEGKTDISNDRQRINSLGNLMTPISKIERIMSIVSNDQEPAIGGAYLVNYL